MNAKDVIRAWKDSEYRNSLSPEQRAMLPENPAGAVELNDADLDHVAGGTFEFLGTCTGVCCWITDHICL